MYDSEKMGKIFSDIERYMKDIRSMGIRGAEDLEDKKTFYAASMLVFSASNRAIDLGEEVVSANNLGTPSTYKDIFFLLFKANFINREMKDRLSGLAYYRNLLSHNYHEFSAEDVAKAIGMIGTIEDFARRVKAKMK